MTDLARAGRWIVIAVMSILTWQFAWTPLGPDADASLLHLPNLIFHEAGHVLFLPLGRFMTVLGGSLLQVLVPLVCAATFARQHGNWFACAVCAWWAGQNLVDIAPYVADARALQLPLLGGLTGAEVEGHDWEYLLSALGLLHRDLALGRVTHLAGQLAMSASLIWAVTLVLRHREIDSP